jgi:serine/threonine protein kinase
MRDEEAGSTRDDKIVVDVAELEPARAARGPAAPRVHADGSDPGRALPTPAAGSSKTVAGLVSNQTVVLRAAPPVIGKPRAPKPTSQTSIGAGIFAAPRTITGEQWAEGEMPSVGAHIHHYELIRELGAGGMGTVYLARDERLGRKVAIKVLQSQAPELALRFLIEARATARCHHENIVVIYEVGQVNPSQPYMVLEFLKGQPLSDQLPEGQPLPVPRCVELLTPVLRALVCAHAEGIVHRDLKPDNILVTRGGVPKLTDLGLAKVFAEDASEAAAPALTDEQRRQAASRDTGLTMPGTMMGTLQYMAPEQFGIGIEIDARTDVWAMGVILFRMLTGRGPLYPLEGNELLVTAIMDQPMPRLRDVAPQLPRALADVVDRCLMKDPAERWPTAAALLDALAPFSPGRYSPRALGQDESPYAGLASFQESDAGRFFGRSREIAAAALRIRDRPIMAIAGPSGVGQVVVRARRPGARAQGRRRELGVPRAAARAQPAGGARRRHGSPDAAGQRRGRGQRGRGRRGAAVPARQAARAARPPRHGPCASAPSAPAARSCCSSISSRSCTRWPAAPPSGSRSPPPWPARPTTRPRRSGWSCRCARTTSTAWPRTRRSWPRSPAACSS